MVRASLALLAGMLLAMPGVARAAEADPAGNWKVSLFFEGKEKLLWLLKVDKKDDKWSGEIIGQSEGAKKATARNFTFKDGTLQFGIKIDQGPVVTFSGKLNPDSPTKILGSAVNAGEVIPAQLSKTTLESLEAFDVNKEIVASQAAGPEVVNAALELLALAGEKKAKQGDVRNWADRAVKAAQPYGRPYYLETILTVTATLLKEDDLTAIALEYARRAEKMLEPADKPNLQFGVLNNLAEALKKAKKTDEAKEIETRLNKIPAVQPEKFAGREGKSDRVILVELFTGAECPPCVGADYAFDALAKTYKPSDVVLLEYHLHIPRPDPLTNAASEARSKYYGIGGTPAALFSGLLAAEEGGSKRQAQGLYDQFISGLNPLLERPATAQLKAFASRKGDKVDITATVLSVDKPGDKLRLRLVLVEDEVSYKGGNGIAEHHHVVRAMPGGDEGIAVDKKTAKQSVSVDLEELRKSANKFLDDSAKDLKDRPMELKNLRVVAFVQDDGSREILQAIEVEVKAE